ncbi:MAG: hypothetical protein ABIW82_10175 [Dokdonella sp.]
MPLLTKTLTGLSLALSCVLVHAAPKDDLHEAFGKFLKAHSFHATVTDIKKGEQVSAMDFVAPDRYRLKSSRGPEQTIIGDAIYMDLNGKLTRLPVPGVGKMTSQFRNEDFLHEVEGGMSVQALPDEAVDGEPAKVYAYTTTKPAKSDAKTWISLKTGLPIQIESTGSFMGHSATTRVRYSNFDDPSIRIDTPN